MHGLVTTAKVGVVHQVVVQQRVVMVSLQCGGLHENALRVILVELIGKQHEHWPNALATHGQHIAYRIVEGFGLAIVRKAFQEMVDLSQKFF